MKTRQLSVGVYAGRKAYSNMKKGAAMKGCLLAGLGAIAAVLLTAGSGFAAQNVIKYRPHMHMSELEGRPDSDRIQLPNGRLVRLGQLRMLEAAGKEIRAAAARRRPVPPALREIPVATPQTVQLRSAADLSAMLKRPDTDTMRLPSGRVVTVGQLKFLQPQLEKKLGRRLGDIPQRQSLSGPAVKVGKDVTRAEWDAIMRKPDSTVLESAGGKRTTVGELKRAIAAEKESGRTKSAPRKWERRNDR